MTANRFRFRAWSNSAKAMIRQAIALDTFNGRIAGDVDWILMQSTGLCDKNGKEIFEGDIVVRSTKLYPSQKPDVIKWYDDWDHDLVGFQVCSKDEVIGNIYEHGHLNPELLKGEK